MKKCRTWIQSIEGGRAAWSPAQAVFYYTSLPVPPALPVMSVPIGPGQRAGARLHFGRGIRCLPAGVGGCIRHNQLEQAQAGLPAWSASWPLALMPSAWPLPEWLLKMLLQLLAQQLEQVVEAATEAGIGQFFRGQGGVIGWMVLLRLALRLFENTRADA